MVQLTDAKRVYVHDTSKPETRVNHLRNPRGLATGPDWSLWNGIGGTGAAFSNVTDGPFGVPNGRRATWGTPPTSGAGHIITGRLGETVQAGRTYTMSAYVRPPYSLHVAPQMIFKLDAAVASGTIGFPGQPCPVNVWTRVSQTVTSVGPSNTIEFRLYRAGTYDPLPWIETAAVLIEETNEVRPYFDGGFAAPGYATSWSGVVDLSSPIATRIPERLQAAYLGPDRLARLRTNRLPNPSFEGASPNYAWSAGASPTVSTLSGGVFGGQFRRLTKTVAGAVSLTHSGALADIPVLAGEVWTISAYVRGTPGMQAQMRMSYDSGTTLGTPITLTSATEWVRISMTREQPSDNIMRVHVLSPGTTSVGDVLDIDAVLAERTPDLLPYFDGETPNAEWTGPENASPSTLWDNH